MVVSVAYLLRSRINHYYNGVRVIGKLKYQSCNTNKRSSGEITNFLFETYKNSVIPHGKNIFKAASGMYMATICAYSSSNYALPYWKCVLRCYAKCPRIDIPSPESDQHNNHVSHTICFHVYRALGNDLWVRF